MLCLDRNLSGIWWITMQTTYSSPNHTSRMVLLTIHFWLYSSNLTVGGPWPTPNLGRVVSPLSYKLSPFHEYIFTDGHIIHTASHLLDCWHFLGTGQVCYDNSTGLIVDWWATRRTMHACIVIWKSECPCHTHVFIEVSISLTCFPSLYFSFVCSFSSSNRTLTFSHTVLPPYWHIPEWTAW